jgi:hypothetical protein
MSQKVRRLRQPRWNRVDLVHMGANYDPASGEGSHVVLFKAAPPDPKPEVVTFPSATNNLTWTGAAVSGTTPFVVRLGGDSSAQPAGGATIAPKASAESAPSPGDKPVGDTPNAPAAPADQPEPVAEPVAAAAPTTTPSTEAPAPEPQPDIAKAMADMRAELAVEKARADQVEKALREMREVEAERVFTDHAKQFETVAPVEDLLPVLKAAAAAGPESLEKLDAILKAAAARITTVDKWATQTGSNHSLFAEVGTAKQASPNGALGELDSLAADVMKADPELSVEQARSRVLRSRKDLYGEYIANHPSTPVRTR